MRSNLQLVDTVRSKMDDFSTKESVIQAKDGSEMDADELRLAQMGILLHSQRRDGRVLTTLKVTLRNSSVTSVSCP